MTKILKVTDVWGDTQLINTDYVVKVEPCICTVHKKDVPVWGITLQRNTVSLSQEDYDIDDIKAGLEGYDSTFYHKSYKKDKEMAAKEKQEQQPQEPHFEYPILMDRYSFTYKKCKNFMDEADDFIMNDSSCYLMDGNPLTTKAIKIPELLASNLIQSYSFDNPVRNLSWIEIDGHLALLFNNRAE